MRVFLFLCIPILLLALATPLWASVESEASSAPTPIVLGVGVEYARELIWTTNDTSEPIGTSSKALYLYTDFPIFTTTKISIEGIWHHTDPAWVTPLTALRGYDSAGLRCGVPIAIASYDHLEFSIAPTLGLWYGLYANTPLAFAYAEAGLSCAATLKISSLPVALRLQLPGTMVFRKDIPLQFSFGARLLLLVEVH